MPRPARRDWESPERSLREARRLFGGHWPAARDAITGRPVEAWLGSAARAAPRVARLLEDAAERVSEALGLASSVGVLLGPRTASPPEGLEDFPDVLAGGMVGVEPRRLAAIGRRLQTMAAEARRAAESDNATAAAREVSPPRGGGGVERVEVLRLAASYDPGTPLDPAAWAYAEIGLGVLPPCRRAAEAWEDPDAEWARRKAAWKSARQDVERGGRERRKPPPRRRSR